MKTHLARLARFALRLATALALVSAAGAQAGTVISQQQIGENSGGFGGVLDMQDHFGWSVAPLGDLDGDGIPDLAVGSPGRGAGSLQGTIWILFMNADGTVASEQEIGSGLGGFGGVITFGDFFGNALAGLGDLNGDGVGDLAVGTDSNDGGSHQGSIWILFLNPDGTVLDEQKISETAGGFGGVLNPDDRFGAALAALGDLDGDGNADLAVGAARDDESSLDQGSVWILFLNPNGTVADERKISALEGGFGGSLDAGDEFGISLATLGDLDGDGAVDLAVGAYTDDDGANNQGAVWILFLNPDGTVADEQKISALEGGFGGDLDPSDLFGRSVAPAGDLDGDGVIELAVGAYGDDDGGTSQGAVWILSLNRDGTVADEQKISATAGQFGGSLDPGDFFGLGLGSAGDLDGDGIGELAVGAPFDADVAIQQGSFWVLSLEACVCLDFEQEDDFTTPLANGQDISTPPEFGALVSISSSGPNAGAAIFDSTPDGPNDPSQDLDLLVGSGKVLMLQTDANTTQTVAGVFDRPNDDEDGGTFTLSFARPVELRSVDLVDIDSGADEACMLVLTDTFGRLRLYSVPPGWTGDLLADGVGKRTLDLASLAPQPGFASTATAVQDPNFAAARVVSLSLQLGSSGALDNLCWRPDPKGFHPGPSARPSHGSGMPGGPVAIGLR